MKDRHWRERKAEAIALIEQGLTVREIELKGIICRRTLYKYFNELNADRTRANRVSRANKEFIKEQLKLNTPGREIAKAIGVSDAAISYWIRRIHQGLV